MAFLLLILPFISITTASSSTKIPETATAVFPCDSFDNIPMEMAQIQFHTNLSAVYIYGISDECYNCLHLPLNLYNLNTESICVMIDTQHPYSIGYSSEMPFAGCHPKFNKTNGHTCAWQPSTWIIPPISYHYHQYEHYSIRVEQTKTTTATLKTAANKYIPLYIAIFAMFVIIISYNIYQLYLKNSCIGGTDESGPDSLSFLDNSPKKVKKAQRFVSLDAFRGMALIIMIFVNYGGGGYWWLDHSAWNGLTVADLVFPWFIFSMGFAMAIVFPRKLKKIAQQQDDNMGLTINADGRPQLSRWSLLNKVMSRTAKLFIIGVCIINGGNNLEYLRIPGVLQYFAVSYCINSLIVIFTEPLEDLEEKSVPAMSNLFVPEVMLYWKQWIVALCILCTNLIIVFVLPVTMYNEKCPKGYLGPGGIGDFGKHMECTGGAHRYMDWKFFGMHHLYQYPTCRAYYGSGWYDPEGLMGSLTATLLTFFGILVGRILTIYKSHKRRIVRWCLWCVIFGLVAGSFCGFKQNGGMIPVNKNLWSLSFICCQASTGIVVLIVFYLLIDVGHIWSGLPFQWLGSNSIIIYTGSEIFGDDFPWSFSYKETDHYKLLLSNIIGVSLWIALAGYLFKKKIFYAL